MATRRRFNREFKVNVLGPFRSKAERESDAGQAPGVVKPAA